jgi:hypothetical protein
MNNKNIRKINQEAKYKVESYNFLNHKFNILIDF